MSYHGSHAQVKNVSFFLQFARFLEKVIYFTYRPDAIV
jgi:hypothetical protein